MTVCRWCGGDTTQPGHDHRAPPNLAVHRPGAVPVMSAYEYIARRDHSGNTREFPAGWDGLLEFVKWDWSWLATRMLVIAEFQRQRIADIDGYVPAEARREARDHAEAGRI